MAHLLCVGADVPLWVPLLALVVFAAILLVLFARTPDDDPDWVVRAATLDTWEELSGGRLAIDREGPLLVIRCWRAKHGFWDVTAGRRQMSGTIIAVDEAALFAIGNEGWAQTQASFRLRAEGGPPIRVYETPWGPRLIDPVSGLRATTGRRGDSEKLVTDLRRRGWPVEHRQTRWARSRR
jgi:hypothetical protein